MSDVQQDRRNRHERVLAYRALFHVLLLVLLNVFARDIIFQDAGIQASSVFMLFMMLALGQLACILLDAGPKALLPLFLADACLFLPLVKATGSSSSPFLVLFPILSLASALSLPTKEAYVAVVGALLAMVLSVGFGPAIVGNAAAIILTGVLGIYLVRALRDSGQALQRSEGARRRLESLQKAILANIPSGLMSVDTEGRVIQVNFVGLRILGLNETDVVGRGVDEVIPPVRMYLDRLNTLVPSVGLEDLQSERPTFTVQRGDGSRIHLGYSVARLTDPEDKSLIGTLVVFQDLTRVMELENTLRQNEKLAAVGKLAAGIAHEIRNPLAGISGSAQLLAGLAGLGDEDQALLRIIQRESGRLDVLIGEFLEYVRPQQLELAAVDLRQISANVLESLRVNSKWQELKSEAVLKVNLKDPSRPFLVRGEEKKITQVLMNLILNAGQAGAKRVEIELRDPAVLLIKDNGCGISVENQTRIFEPFFTTKEKGTGLGLAITYKTLQAMGAQVRVQSPLPEFAEKGGTMFSVTFQTTG